MTGARHAGAHRAASASPLVRLVGGLLVVGGVAILVAIALQHSSGAPTPRAVGSHPASVTTPRASAEATPTTTPSPSAASAPQSSAASTATTDPVQAAPLLPLLVLNNSRIHDLASRAADDFRGGGWPVRGTGNFRGRVAMTTVYFEPGQEASARRLMREFGKIRRMSPRFTGLPGRGLTVVVTRDYAAS